MPSPAIGLDEHLVAARGQLAHGGRRHADAVFVVLDFLRNADAHGASRRQAYQRFFASRTAKKKNTGNSTAAAYTESADRLPDSWRASKACVPRIEQRGQQRRPYQHENDEQHSSEASIVPLTSSRPRPPAQPSTMRAISASDAISGGRKGDGVADDPHHQIFLGKGARSTS